MLITIRSDVYQWFLFFFFRNVCVCIYFSLADYNWEIIAIDGKKGGCIFVHFNLLAMVENAALKSHFISSTE